MEVDYQVRRQNLISLMDAKRGEAARIAKLSGIEPNYLSRIKAGKKNLGEELSRRIEKVLGLEPNWLDVDHSGKPTEATRPEKVVITAQSEEELVKLLREKGEAYAFELLRKAFMEQENKKGD
ncbi:helix-turn-helix domain-containing protein [Chromobacterium piscinae]|uniref:helix-turn-helix domain-containing protein n=1 Tax=Chromobacterium piscinae TaxID=686831 RepID=UPI003F80B3A9